MINMARPKGDIERDRSIRVPVSEEEFNLVHELRGDVPLTTFLRRLIEAEAKRQGVKPGRRAKR